MNSQPRCRVAVVRTSAYDPAELDRSISKMLALLGGLEQWVRPGMNVLLKPNLLSAKAPERAITTHPEFVASVGRAAARLGARVMIGDSPAGAEKGIDRLWNNCGLTAIAARDGFELINFERSGSSPVKVGNNTYYIAKPVLDADLVISLAKLKTHVLTLMTGGVKNTFGCIPGFRKGLYHKEAPNPRHFARILVDIHAAVRPGLTVMDAVIAMEGDGPASGAHRNVGLILGSRDAVGMDTVASALIGLPPMRVQTTRLAAEAGLGIGDLSEIDVVGESLESVRIADFKLTSNLKMELLPKFVFDSVSRLIWQRPRIRVEDCTRCQACIESCPTGAMMRGEDGSTPNLEESKCINCWCCHEICPSKAIEVEKSWLARRVL